MNGLLCFCCVLAVCVHVAKIFVVVCGVVVVVVGVVVTKIILYLLYIILYCSSTSSRTSLIAHFD
jgi:hypothetical protein